MMAPFIAMVHKDRDTSYGVSFPDFPGSITSAASLSEAMDRARELVSFIAETWEADDGPFPQPRTIDELRRDPEFIDDSSDAILIAVPLEQRSFRPAAE
jgi:predicted RNase H-like HicB family nuclease